MAEFTLDDMISSAIDSKPETFKDAFNSVMAAKIAQAVEDRKQEIASSMLADEEPDTEQEDSDDNQDLEDFEQNEAEVENAEDTETSA